MDFKKKLEKKLGDENLVQQHKKQASKSVFLIAAFIFFSNIFLVGSDKNGNLWFLQFLLPFSYAFFIASMCFLALCTVDNLLPEKYKQYKKIIMWIIVALFIIPVLVFFIQGNSVITN